ncbi:MAG: oxygenase MpaB family protein [Actinomycetota bacterium]
MATGPLGPLDDIRDRLGRGIREMLAGSPDQPTYEPDPGPRRFGPDSGMWAVHTDVAMLIGGLRALLLQTLHPLALAGVTQHSSYKTDPLGRLHRTAAFVGTTTFGTVEESDQAIAVVRSIHERVAGTARDGRSYSALDPHLLAWVHCTEAHSFLQARLRYGDGPLSDTLADRYVAEIGEIGAALGVEEPPQTRDELRTRLQSYRSELVADRDTRETVRFLVFPPSLPIAARAPYGVLFGAAVTMLPRFAQRMLRLPVPPLSEPLVVRPAATALLRTIGWALGDHPATRSAGVDT